MPNKSGARLRTLRALKQKYKMADKTFGIDYLQLIID